jgi:hypothetical protein
MRIDARGRLECFDFQGVWDIFYNDCDEKTARWAFEHLTPQPTECLVEPISVPAFWKAGLPRSYVRCRQDRAHPHSVFLDVVNRLGVQPLTMDSSHSPFLSQPAALAGVLVQATTTAPVGTLRPA